MDFMTREELDQIMALARKISDVTYTFMAIMAYAGLRPTEALSLKVRDIHVMGHIVSELTLPGTNTKTRTGRDVPVPQILHDILERYLDRRGLFEDPSHYLFGTAIGGHFTLRNMQYAVRKLGYAALHRHVTPKTFRHTYATLLARKAPIRSVQQALGHASLSSTQVYAHPIKDDLKQAVTAVFDQTPPRLADNPPLPITYPIGKE